MKHLLQIVPLFLLLQIAVLSLPIQAAHVRRERVIILKIQTMQESSEPIDPDEKSHRSQSYHYTMVISEGVGVNISNIDKTGILAYEVLNESEESIGKFCDEYEFVDFILSQTEPVMIRILFADFILYGWTN